MQSISSNSVSERVMLDEFKSLGMKAGDKLKLGSLVYKFHQDAIHQGLNSILQKGWIKICSEPNEPGEFELTDLGFLQL